MLHCSSRVWVLTYIIDESFCLSKLVESVRVLCQVCELFSGRSKRLVNYGISWPVQWAADLTSSSVGINLRSSSQCSGKSPSRSAFMINSVTRYDVWPILLFAITGRDKTTQCFHNALVLLASTLHLDFWLFFVRSDVAAQTVSEDLMDEWRSYNKLIQKVVRWTLHSLSSLFKSFLLFSIRFTWNMASNSEKSIVSSTASSFRSCGIHQGQ